MGGHSHTQPTYTSTVPVSHPTVDFATRKKMPLSLHTRISSALMKGLLASFIPVVAADAAHNPALTHEENIKAALGDWERGLSGKPINCRRFVDLFIDDGVWSSPAGARNKLAPTRWRPSCRVRSPSLASRRRSRAPFCSS